MSTLKTPASICCLIAVAVGGWGCAGSKQRQRDPLPMVATKTPHHQASLPPVVLASHLQESEEIPPETLPPPAAGNGGNSRISAPGAESLEDLEVYAIGNNPTLRRMREEAAAERARSGYADKLPDPTVGVMVFGDSMKFVPDRQLAEAQIMQMIPWIGRLKAEARQAQMEALAAENQYHAERLRVVGDLRAAWYKLYILHKQIETTQTDKAQLELLIKTANSRIATGDAQPGDVLMATLEFSSLQEQLLSYRQQVVATTAELNRHVGRDSSAPISPPKSLDAELPDWSHELLRQIALEAQPELVAARQRTAAARWGIDVARLKRRPDVTLGANWMVMAADPADTAPGAGDDAWTLGVTTSLPIWHRKYSAMQAEAASRHLAAHATEDEVALRLDALLRDLWEQARAGQQTVQLYEKTILPQARQTYEADQKSLVNNKVTFDRVIRDYRTLLNLEIGYHRALGQFATTLARIRQAVGVDLLATPEPGRT